MIAVAIILNGISRRKKKFYAEIEPVLAKHFSLKIFETQYSGHASALAAVAAAEGFEYVLAAGGDGTLNQVLNGLVSPHPQPLSIDGEGGSTTRKRSPILGFIPLGTGNDFARACSLRADPLQIVRLIESGSAKPTDVGKLDCADDAGNNVTRYFINCCSLGMGPEVVKRLERSSRFFGPLITYHKAIVATFLKHVPSHVLCESDNWKWEGNVRVLGVCNGRSFGGGIYLAPDALPDDGLFNIFIGGQIPLIKFLVYLHLLKSARKLNDKAAIYQTSASLHLTSSVKTPLETEGELAGYLPATIDLLPGRINFLR